MTLDTQSRSFRAIFALALTAGCAAGCSLLLHSDASQCSKDSDCVTRGFATDTTCEVTTGTCIAKGNPEGGGEAGISCQKYSDCPQPTGGSQQVAACDVDTKTCIQVTSEECPFVIGDYMHTPAPVFIGAFATIPTSGPTTDPSYENYALAQGDFASMGGVELAPALGGLRMPVVVVCDNTADTSVVMHHLINDVHVAVLVADLDTTPLLTTFSVNNGDASAPTVLFINPFGSNDTFARVNTQSLLWSLLGQPSDVAQAYQAYFPWVEAYVRKTQDLVAADEGGAAPPMRVATVTSASTDPQQLSDAVIPLLKWGGGPATMSNNPNYLGITMNVSELNADASAMKVTTAVSKAVTQLLAFKPNVVVSFAGDEFDNVLVDLDFEWTMSMGPKPFYLIGPYNSASTSLLEWSNNSASNRSRLAGITFADAPANDPVLVNYEQEFVSTYGGTLTSAGYFSNYYDAMYYAVYSLAAAGSKLSGINAAEGMLDLTNTIPPATRSYDMGPADIAGVESALGAPGTPVVSLNGTLGPPTFNRGTGARVGQGDVYCADLGSSGPVWTYDVLRLEASDGGSPLDGAPLEGTFPCFDGMAPPP